MPVPELRASSGSRGARRPRSPTPCTTRATLAPGEAVDRRAEGLDHARRGQRVAGPDRLDDLDRPVADGADQQGALGDRLVARHAHAAAQRAAGAKAHGAAAR